MKKLTNVGLALVAMLAFTNISSAQAVKAVTQSLQKNH
jgi:hypothetical protein